jgi:3-methyladenine DNA glycosylase/8-oxoguanine DNA glycosylase
VTTLGFDPHTAVAHLQAADPTLARLIDAVGPLRLELRKSPSLFAELARAIVYQQLHGKAAATIHARLCALFPRSRAGLTPEHVLGASDAKLRGAGLSRAKLLALRDLARRTRDGELPTLAAARRMHDEDLVERLTEVRGVGRWTAEMLLIFRLGRPDVLPVGDYGVRKGYAIAFRKRELPQPAELERRGERWRPYRTAASWYLWRATDRAPG